MNKDHQADLSVILRHKLGVVAQTPPELKDISLSSITILADGRTYTVPISPPMGSWADRRARLVDMTLAARSALGVDAEGNPIVVKTFVPPTGFGAVSLVGVAFYFACAAAVKLGFVAPGTAAWGAAEAVFPGGGEEFVTVVESILLPVLGIHLGECWWLDRSRLSKFGVPRGGALWWKWTGLCFLTGFPTFKSFDAVVKREGKKE
jgi:hypothetical protein